MPQKEYDMWIERKCDTCADQWTECVPWADKGEYSYMAEDGKAHIKPTSCIAHVGFRRSEKRVCQGLCRATSASVAAIIR